MSNTIAIVGRPNVGKSTLFNRLTESRAAIVDETSGVTRDRHYGKVEWGGRTFSIIDTGGYVSGSGDVFEQEIRDQVNLAINEADLIIFLTDVTTGLTDLDDVVAKMLRKSKKKVFLVVNKVDNTQRINEVSEFYKLGLGDIYPLSSISGSGTGELLDDIIKNLKEEEEEQISIPRLAIVGQPNVGKSSLLNALIGDKRTIVTPIPGTTRDAIDVRYQAFGFDFYLVDTAGLRKKTKVRDDLEFYSVMRTVRAIENSDVCLLLIDATLGLNAQDISIFHLAEKNKKGVLILVNKWDLMESKEKDVKSYEEKIKNKLAPFSDVPVIFTSVIQKQRVHKSLETALEVFNRRLQKISTSKLNKIMLPYIESHPAPSVKGKNITIKYITQLPGSVPRFVFFSNNPQYIKESYRRYLENKMRENFDFKGVPLTLYFRNKDSGKEN